MIVDSSVLVAILQAEPETDVFVSKIIAADGASISSAAYVEIGIVIDRAGDGILSERMDAVIDELGIEIAPVTETQARRARSAHRRFGKGSGHPARLNFGDCFAYALATERNDALLFKGNDFTHTDVKQA